MSKYQAIVSEIKYWISMLPTKERRYNFNYELQLLIDLSYCNVACNMKDFEALLNRVKKEVCGG